VIRRTRTRGRNAKAKGKGLYFGYRLLLLIPQSIAVSVVAFILLHMIPGDPAKVILGPLATPSSIQAIRKQLGLDKPIWTQYGVYLSNLLHGDLGRSTSTSNSVLADIGSRAAPTLELLTLAIIALVVLAMLLGLLGVFRPKNPITRIASLYSSTAGSFPDFWVGLVFLYIFYFTLHLAPAPTGQLSPMVIPPPKITGSALLDSVLSLNGPAAWSALSHLILPLATLVLVNLGPVLRMANATFEQLAQNRSIFFARSLGLPKRVIAKRIIKQSLPPILTLTGTVYVFLLAGIVVTEQVFSWGGLGQYVVSAVQQSDYFAVLGFLIISSIFTLCVYLVIDFVHAMSDPRVELGWSKSGA